MSNYPNNPSGYPNTPSGYPNNPSPYPNQPPSSYGGPPPPNQPPSSYGGPPPPNQPPSSYGGPPPPNQATPYGQNPPYGGGYPTPPSAPYGSPFASLAPSAFPPGTDPNIVSSFQNADHDRSGFIDDNELQRALSTYNQTFSMRTVHLLMYTFTNSNVRKIGPSEFTQLFYSIQSWKGIFERFDRDRSGKIDANELRDALLSLGFSVSPVILDLLVSKFDKTGGRNKAIEYDNFIECCLTVKGLTEKFKEKDPGFTGSATFNYDSFMLTLIMDEIEYEQIYLTTFERFKYKSWWRSLTIYGVVGSGEIRRLIADV